MLTAKPKISVFVALVHETLKLARFASFADLIETVKCRAARLRLHYDSVVIGDAVEHVARIRPMPILSSSGPMAGRHEERPSDAPAIGRDEAAAILARLGTIAAVKAMPTQKSPTVLDWRAQVELIATAQLEHVALREQRQQRSGRFARSHSVMAEIYAPLWWFWMAVAMFARQIARCEIEEKYCEVAARRLQQEALPLEVA